jgi:neutral trehalase
MTAIATRRPVDVAISGYIQKTWDTLTRSHADLAAVAADPKSHPDKDGKWRIFVPENEDLSALTDKLGRQMKPADFAKIALLRLPRKPLYRMEMETAEILETVGRTSEAPLWRKRAADRADAVNRLMWDEKAGMHFDYDFVHRRRRQYPFLTTFYPLWVGIASKEQAQRVMSHLAKFERPGGLRTSTYRSGDQWDSPLGWAPLQYIAVEGTRRYGYRAEADRISKRFLKMVEGVFRQRGTIVEKYDVCSRRADIGGEMRFGYHTNEPGFGWTNAVYTALYDQVHR